MVAADVQPRAKLHVLEEIRGGHLGAQEQVKRDQQTEERRHFSDGLGDGRQGLPGLAGRRVFGTFE